MLATEDPDLLFAERITYERERLGWTYDETATRLAEVGCRVHSTAVYKLEKRGRRANINEIKAFARIFGTDVNGILRSMTEVAEEEVGVLIEELEAADAELERAAAKLWEIAKKMVRLARADPSEGLDRIIRALEAIETDESPNDQPVALRQALERLVPIVLREARNG